MTIHPEVKIFRSGQVREIDAYTIINEPIASVDLMERASVSVFEWIKDHFSKTIQIFIFAGTGNNGGDGLVVGRLLTNAGYNVSIYLARYSKNISDDCQINFNRLQQTPGASVVEMKEKDAFPDIPGDSLVIDALFGSGLSRPLEGRYAGLVKHINDNEAKVVSIDIPSGLFGEDNSTNNYDHIVRANHTLSLQFQKLAFQFQENDQYAGDVVVLPIGLHKGVIDHLPTPYAFISGSFVRSFVKKRDLFSHKGNFGHVLLISGCYGKMGAAVLASRACLRSGVGLLTTHVPGKGNDILQTAVPEAMISLDQSDIIFTQAPPLSDFSNVGIGPALGCKHNSREGLRELIRSAETPMVLDADAINILGANPDWITDLPQESVLTPHPKEFQRLTGKNGTGYQRHKHQIEFSKKHKMILVLKGAHTSISFPDGSCFFNTTGNPGMATAGSGDVLTGIILALLGQGYNPADAAILGVYVHGLAGDLARDKIGEEALIASDIIDHLGPAFRNIRSLEE